MEIISRREARDRGLIHYFSGKPCPYGHIKPRYLNGDCIACAKVRGEVRRRTQRAAVQEAQRKFRKTHIEQRRKRDRDHKRHAYKANPIPRLNSNRQWRNQNPGKVLAINLRRRARTFNAEGSLTAAERDTLLSRATRCYHCGKKFNSRCRPTLDHLIALSKGGKHDITNVVVACHKCNPAKGNRPFNPVTGQGILL